MKIEFTNEQIQSFAASHKMLHAFKYAETRGAESPKSTFYEVLTDSGWVIGPYKEPGAPDIDMRPETEHEYKTRVVAAMKHRASVPNMAEDFWKSIPGPKPQWVYDLTA